ncbi:hypothetical protein MASR1M46_10560 [Bacteroidales bacterium]
MQNIEKVSEIKVTVSALLKNIEEIEKGALIPESKWEELMIQADIIREKLITLRSRELREMVEKISASEETKRLVQSFAELKRAFSDVQLNISRSVIPIPSSGHKKPEDFTEKPDSVLFEDEGDEIELFTDDDTASILDSARSSRPSWRTDLSGSPVDDIKHAITLNDKLFYIKELFNDDEEQYRLSIERINEMRNLDEAVDYIRGAFPEWDEDSPSVYRFLMILRRRFDV